MIRESLRFRNGGGAQHAIAWARFLSTLGDLKNMKTIAVIGGGITGVTTAYTLVRRGFRVTLFERHRYPAMETSFANGGQLSASNAEVWNHWSTVLKGLKWMLRPDAPLLVNPRPSWHKLSWFA
jgi:D-amino-acid dehydrogenase